MAALSGLAAGCLLLAVAAPADAAIRYKRQGGGALAAPDVLAVAADLCETAPGRVWVAVDQESACIAYYPSPGLAGAANAVFYFEGDIPGDLRRDEARLDAHLQRLRQVLEQLAKATRVPFVLVARPGTLGSTGDHDKRRDVGEYRVLDAALDRIRARYKIGKLTLAGQSGGATVAGALLALGRTDVACAAPASGGYDLPGMLDWHAEKRGRDAAHRERPAIMSGQFSVLDHIDGVRPSPGRRIFIIGDPGDQITPFALQQKFAERLKAAGHHVVLIEATGSGADRHGLGHISLRVAGLCASGRSDAEILRAVRP